MVDYALLILLIGCAVAAIRTRDLLSSIILLGAYSLLMAVVWTELNAVDVAFTEASVGAGITSVLLLAALSRTRRGEEFPLHPPAQKAHSLIALVLVILTGAVLAYGTIDMPEFGDPEAPANLHVAPYYIEKSLEETGVGNFVTSVLASYRGYDTFGETTVIFTAGICVIMLLRKQGEK